MWVAVKRFLLILDSWNSAEIWIWIHIVNKMMPPQRKWNEFCKRNKNHLVKFYFFIQISHYTFHFTYTPNISINRAPTACYQITSFSILRVECYCFLFFEIVISTMDNFVFLFTTNENFGSEYKDVGSFLNLLNNVILYLLEKYTCFEISIRRYNLTTFSIRQHDVQEVSSM